MKMLPRVQLSAMMFAQFFIWGAWFVTLGTYMSKGLGFDDIIGATYSTQGLAAIAAPLFVGAIADRMFPAQKVLGILHLLGGIIMYGVAMLTHDKSVFFWGVLAYFMCYMPTLPLVNAIAFNAMQDTQEQFPAVRALGTLGWIVAGVVIGVIPGAAQTHFPMQIAAVMSIIMGIYAFTLPNTPPRAKGEPFNALSLFGLDIASGMKDRNFWIFIVCSLLIVIPLSFYYAYANTFLVDVKAHAQVLGQSFEPAAIQTLGQVSEFGFILLLPLLLRRLGIRWVLIVGMAAWALRYVMFAYGFDTAGAIMPVLLLGIALHGVCYDFFFVAGQIYVDGKFRADERARAQSFLALITLGIGNVIGSNLAGAVYEHYSLPNAMHDWRMIWLVPAILAIIVLLIFVASFRTSTTAAAT